MESHRDTYMELCRCYGGSMADSERRPHARGEIEKLPSGSLRVRVYAGRDPLTRKRRYLMETVPAGPTAARDAEAVRDRLRAEVDRHRAAAAEMPARAEPPATGRQRRGGEL